jgi:hypothetical protein
VRANNGGPAIWNRDTSKIALHHTRVTGNSGGGIWNEGSPDNVTLHKSVIVGNTPYDCKGC